MSRHGVVVFYDYDELALVGGQLPHDAGEPVVRGRDARSAVVPGRTQRCLPEEFRTYLRSPRVVGEVFDEVHPEICTVEFWQEMKDRHQGGERPDFFPYPQQYRFPED